METLELPSLDEERNSSTPEMVLTARSILSVTSISTVSGAAPGSEALTETVGKSTWGKRSTPS
jgi:hypothetical protein